MTALELVREYFPEASDAEADEILWAKTGFPSFFNGDPLTCLREQLGLFWAAVQIGADVCYGCGELAFFDDPVFCDACLIRDYKAHQLRELLEFP